MPAINKDCQRHEGAIAALREKVEGRGTRIRRMESALFGDGNGNPGLIRKIDRLVLLVKLLVVLGFGNILGTLAPELKTILIALLS